MKHVKLLAAAICLILSTAVVASMGPVWAQPASAAFAPPTTPVILTRSVQRPLAGGGEISVTRRYEIRFSWEKDCYRVDGRLLDVRVDAPPQLSRLAELERERSDPGLFPVFLDVQGMIRPSGKGEAARNPSAALSGAQSVLADTALPTSLRRELAGPLGSVAEAGANSVWPPFLFNPGTAQRSTSRDIALPDGSSGRVDITVRADQRAPGQLPQRVERTITTQLSQTRRISHEVWTLTY